MKAILILLATISLLVGCDSGPGPDVAAKGFLEALKTGDFVKAQNYMADADGVKELAPFANPEDSMEGKASAAMFKAIFQKMSYEMVSSIGSSQVGTVKVKMTMPKLDSIDQKQIMNDVTPQMMAASGDKDKMAQVFTDAMVQAINSPNTPMETGEATMPMQKVNNEWKLASFENIKLYTQK
jgi:hypothetical protein